MDTVEYTCESPDNARLKRAGGEEQRMKMRAVAVWLIGLAGFSGLATGAVTAEAGLLDVVAVSPSPTTCTSQPCAVIEVEFTLPIKRNTVHSHSFWAFGRWSGPVDGSYHFSDGDRRVTLIPDQPFFAGEQVTVVLADTLKAFDGSPSVQAHSYQFWIRTLPSSMSFSTVTSYTTRKFPGEDVRSYGGSAADLDRDGFADIAIVNEISADVRVFMNRGLSNGQFDAFIEPTTPVNATASPSETADFNFDGYPDLCVSNTGAGTVSFLLGNGDGTFGGQQERSTGTQPYGIAVLDADGDGDLDVVNANVTSNDLTIMFNDGDGFFSQPTHFSGGGNGERAVAAADMDGDGLLDLVVGAQGSQNIIVNRSNGDGTFTPISWKPAGGAPRMLVTGDVNGDGFEDVAVANGQSDNAAILLGNGDGTLQNADVYEIGDFAGATDLGDLDGDGDLDWAVSHFLEDWVLLKNDGDGDFTVHLTTTPPQVASCSILVDVDNDHDLDMVLIDEFEDVAIIRLNSGTPSGATGDINGDDEVDVLDVLDLLSVWGPCGGCAADLDCDGEVTVLDLLIVLGNWS